VRLILIIVGVLLLSKHYFDYEETKQHGVWGAIGLGILILALIGE
jgi:hypothetical protein